MSKIKIDDKVILRTDVAFIVPVLIKKGEVFNVDLIENKLARISNKTISFVVEIELLEVVENV